MDIAGCPRGRGMRFGELTSAQFTLDRIGAQYRDLDVVRLSSITTSPDFVSSGRHWLDK